MLHKDPIIFVLCKKRIIGHAERIIKKHKCAIRMQFYRGYEVYVLRKGFKVMSPGYFSLYDLCKWIVIHEAEVKHSITEYNTWEELNARI